MTYAKMLRKILAESQPVTCLTANELQEQIDSINDRLRRSMPNSERLLLCGEREAFRKGLELKQTRELA